jgi:nucleoside-diphosphate-sugar epimerase
MRVLLFGGTGRLGSRCIQALLAHGHVLTVYVRNTDKLKSMVTPAVINSLEAVVAGDATDSVAIKKAIEEHNIEAIVDVAGNQVLPWKEYVLSKIAKAVTDAAVAVGKERGKPIRIWLITWPGELRLSGSENVLED